MTHVDTLLLQKQVGISVRFQVSTAYLRNDGRATFICDDMRFGRPSIFRIWPHETDEGTWAYARQAAIEGPR